MTTTTADQLAQKGWAEVTGETASGVVFGTGAAQRTFMVRDAQLSAADAALFTAAPATFRRGFLVSSDLRAAVSRAAEQRVVNVIGDFCYPLAALMGGSVEVRVFVTPGQNAAGFDAYTSSVDGTVCRFATRRTSSISSRGQRDWYAPRHRLTARRAVAVDGSVVRALIGVPFAAGVKFCAEVAASVVSLMARVAMYETALKARAKIATALFDTLRGDGTTPFVTMSAGAQTEHAAAWYALKRERGEGKWAELPVAFDDPWLQSVWRRWLVHKESQLQPRKKVARAPSLEPQFRFNDRSKIAQLERSRVGVSAAFAAFSLAASDRGNVDGVADLFRRAFDATDIAGKPPVKVAPRRFFRSFILPRVMFTFATGTGTIVLQPQSVLYWSRVHRTLHVSASQQTLEHDVGRHVKEWVFKHTGAAWATIDTTETGAIAVQLEQDALFALEVDDHGTVCLGTHCRVPVPVRADGVLVWFVKPALVHEMELAPSSVKWQETRTALTRLHEEACAPNSLWVSAAALGMVIPRRLAAYVLEYCHNVLRIADDTLGPALAAETPLSQMVRRVQHVLESSRRDARLKLAALKSSSTELQTARRRVVSWCTEAPQLRDAVIHLSAARLDEDAQVAAETEVAFWRMQLAVSTDGVGVFQAQTAQAAAMVADFRQHLHEAEARLSRAGDKLTHATSHAHIHGESVKRVAAVYAARAKTAMDARHRLQFWEWKHRCEASKLAAAKAELTQRDVETGLTLAEQLQAVLGRLKPTVTPKEPVDFTGELAKVDGLDDELQHVLRHTATAQRPQLCEILAYGAQVSMLRARQEYLEQGRTGEMENRANERRRLALLLSEYIEDNEVAYELSMGRGSFEQRFGVASYDDMDLFTLTAVYMEAAARMKLVPGADTVTFRSLNDPEHFRHAVDVYAKAGKKAGGNDKKRAAGREVEEIEPPKRSRCCVC